MAIQKNSEIYSAKYLWDVCELWEPKQVRTVCVEGLDKLSDIFADCYLRGKVGVGSPLYYDCNSVYCDVSIILGIKEGDFKECHNSMFIAHDAAGKLVKVLNQCVTDCDKNPALIPLATVSHQILTYLAVYGHSWARELFSWHSMPPMTGRMPAAIMRAVGGHSTDDDPTRPPSPVLPEDDVEDESLPSALPLDLGEDEEDLDEILPPPPPTIPYQPEDEEEEDSIPPPPPEQTQWDMEESSVHLPSPDYYVEVITVEDDEEEEVPVWEPYDEEGDLLVPSAKKARY